MAFKKHKLTKLEAADILEKHNAWRRNEDIPNSLPMQNPVMIGKAIDLLISESRKTCTIKVAPDDEFLNVNVTSCCEIGPITIEKYCPMCGSKIDKTPK